MADNADKLTPMFAQYQSIKKNYPDALLFFRMGDFYEMFFEDAVTASRELSIALTTRNKGSANAVPMCGVPWHAAASYLAQLIDRGYNVAICDQMEDPKAAKGLVARAVTRVVTPGTALEEGALAPKSHNYLGAVFCGLNDSCGFAWADVSTGQWTGIEFRRQTDLWQWVKKIAPAELLVMDGQNMPAGIGGEVIRVARQPAPAFELKRAAERVMKAQGVAELGALGLADKPALTRACGAILAYLEQTQLGQVSQLMPFQPLEIGRRLLIDEFTERNLELFSLMNGRKGKGTLRHLLDDTVTAMGGRLLEDMIRHPFRDMRAIARIQEVVAWFFCHAGQRAGLRAALGNVLDLERVIMRVCLGRALPRDLAALRQSVAALPTVFAIPAAGGLTELPQLLAESLGNVDDLRDLAALFEKALAEALPATATEGGMFKPGYNAELDRQIELVEHGQQKLDALLAEERETLGLPRLRLGFNRVFGHYYETSRASVRDPLPEGFALGQTLANVQRITSEKLKNLSEAIQEAEERRKQIEYEMFQNMIAHVSAQKARILQTADTLAQLDYWQCLGEVAMREDWAMPVLTDKPVVHIRQGRHPVVEAMVGRANFTPNDFHMDGERRLCLLTGPNMAGKSTVLRQVALICILAQMGSMVPAAEAELGIVDRVFSRVGASDNLSRGQSTFMVEMMETARILRQATRRSLIILDEIGRGTSTYDGMAIAWSVVEDLAARCQRQLRTIFATHYHELTALEGVVPGLFTMNIAVGDYDGKEILFLHRLVPGPSDKSYGVEVARIAGIPYPVVQRAREILKQLEGARATVPINLGLPGLKLKNGRASAFERELAALDLTAMAPARALALLQKWQQKLNMSNPPGNGA